MSIVNSTERKKIEALIAERSANYGATPKVNGAGQAPQQLLVDFLDNHDIPRFLYDMPSVPALKSALFFLLTEDGIPCIYYGTEQGFDGAGDNDRFLRECMFGGSFGSLQSSGRHFFDEQHEIYRFLAKVLELRQKHMALRRGRQYLREISDSGNPGSFGLPRMIGGQIGSVVPWARLFANREYLLAINTDADQPRSAWVTLDASLHDSLTGPNASLTCLYSTDAGQIGAKAPIEARNGRAARRDPPHVLLTDLRMSGMDGQDLMKRLHETDATIVSVVKIGRAHV